PFAPLLRAIGECALYLPDHIARRKRDRARISFHNQTRVAFLLTGHHMVDNHWTTCSNRFLDRSAAGLADEEMILLQHARQFISPADDLCLVTIDRSFNRGPEFVSTTNGHC